MPDAVARALDQPWCDLAGLAPASHGPDRNLVVAMVLAHLLPALDVFDVEGLAPFLRRYAAFDALAGQAVTLYSATATQSGTALGIAEDGALRLRLDDGREQNVHAGEVSVRRTVAA
jgi:BirA family biotin operon repressor/biotin-[acetyl-CoA-carboxylase] ligase